MGEGGRVLCSAHDTLDHRVLRFVSVHFFGPQMFRPPTTDLWHFERETAPKFSCLGAWPAMRNAIFVKWAQPTIDRPREASQHTSLTWASSLTAERIA